MIKQLTERLLRKSVNVLLGRWGIHDNIQTSLKIKYANEYNCGTCNISKNSMMGLETVPDCKPK